MRTLGGDLDAKGHLDALAHVRRVLGEDVAARVRALIHERSERLDVA